MIRFIVLILLAAFVCAVFAIHSRMEENEKSDKKTKNNLTDKVAKGKD